MKKQISIIGCGWLGFPLALYLKENNYNIKGSTTSLQKLSHLRDQGIDGHYIKLTESELIGNKQAFLEHSDTIIINIPPGIRQNSGKNHVSEIKQIVEALIDNAIKNVIYISSTSVFKDDIHYPIITANTEPNGRSVSAKQLIKIEEMLKNNPNFNTSILRFGGLYDSVRHPGRFLSGKTNIANANGPVNLIHKMDAIKIIHSILQQDKWNTIYNATYPDHPKKKAYYTNYCKRHQLTLPQFNTTDKSKGKIIDSTLLEEQLNYNFSYNLQS